MAETTASTVRTLSEHTSKELLAEYGVPVATERVVATAPEAAAAAEQLGLPVVLKLHGERIAHKTERGLVRLGLSDAASVEAAGAELLALVTPEDGECGLLVASMVSGRRELIAGLVRDPQFGPCVMLGLGGVLTEALGDAVFAAAPLTDRDARRLLERLQSSRLFLEPFRGEPAIDVEALTRVLTGLGRLGLERPDVRSVDINPLIVQDGRPVAVDALVELGEPVERAPEAVRLSDEEIRERFRPLFYPKGVIVAGVSEHPGRLGSVAFHNIVRFGYEGRIFPVARSGAELYGYKGLRDVSEVPAGEAELIVLCTPAAVNAELLRSAAAVGVRAAFCAAGGYREIGEEGARLEDDLARAARETGVLLAGPNGQGLVSTGASLCAQFLAPYPPRGGISIASQSGNLMSSLLNYSRATGIGVSKAISVGNATNTTMADYLEYFAVDDETEVVIAYIEGVGDGVRFREVASRLVQRKPLIVIKGGVAAEGKRAAASHTGSMASDDRIFDGVARQLGILRAGSIEEAFEWAASFATQPLPQGRRTVVFTTVGGWGVLSADACAAAGLDLVPLPEDLLAAIDELVPARWSRANPIDLAGGETRDTIPDVLELVAAHPEIDAVLYLGLGIQGNQAQAFKSGSLYPGDGLERLVEFHERQEARYAEAAREASSRHDKPVLAATELVHASGEQPNPGVAALQALGGLCYPSGDRAIRALAALVEYAEFRGSLTARV